MHVVILAAGKGTRLAHLTTETPKPLIPVLGRPILDRILASLPSAITDIFVVTKHKEEHIHSFCTSHPRASNIRCISQSEVSGTYGALLSAADLVASPFMVINGDDIHSQSDLSRLTTMPRAFGISWRVSHGYYAIEQTSEGIFENMRPQTETESGKKVPIATGAYILDADFFALEPKQLKNGEYGIPHTLLGAKDTYNIPVVDMPDWVPINTLEDLKDAEMMILA